MASPALKLIEEEIYKLRQQCQCLKDLLYYVCDWNTADKVKDWTEKKLKEVKKLNEKVETVTDVETFVKNLYKDTKTNFDDEDK